MRESAMPADARLAGSARRASACEPVRRRRPLGHGTACARTSQQRRLQIECNLDWIRACTHRRGAVHPQLRAQPSAAAQGRVRGRGRARRPAPPRRSARVDAGCAATCPPVRALHAARSLRLRPAERARARPPRRQMTAVHCAAAGRRRRSCSCRRQAGRPVRAPLRRLYSRRGLTGGWRPHAHWLCAARACARLGGRA